MPKYCGYPDDDDVDEDDPADDEDAATDEALLVPMNPPPGPSSVPTTTL